LEIDYLISTANQEFKSEKNKEKRKNTRWADPTPGRAAYLN
jgi:hypothetical protein